MPLHASVVTPPPLNGMSLVSTRFLDAMAARGAVHSPPVRCPPWVPRALWPYWKHLALRHALRQAGTETAQYFVPDAGRGLHLNRWLQAPLLARRGGRIYLHHHVFSYLTKADPRFTAFRARLGDKVSHIVLCPQMGDQIRALYGLADPVHVLGNSVFLADLPPPRARTALRCLGFLGNITRAKGIDAVLATARAAQARHPDLRVQIAGPVAEGGIKTALLAFVAEDPGRRIWLGPVGGAAKAAFLAEADLMLFPTRYANEAQPMVIFEALAAGIPVLATARGGITDQIGQADWLLPEDRFAQAAVALIDGWIAQPDSFAAAGRTALAQFRAHQTRDAAALAALAAEIFAP